MLVGPVPSLLKREVSLAGVFPSAVVSGSAHVRIVVVVVAVVDVVDVVDDAVVVVVVGGADGVDDSTSSQYVTSSSDPTVKPY